MNGLNQIQALSAKAHEANQAQQDMHFTISPQKVNGVRTWLVKEFNTNETLYSGSYQECMDFLSAIIEA